MLCGTGLCCEKSCELLAEQPNPLRFAVEDSDEVLTFPELGGKSAKKCLRVGQTVFVPRTSREECAKIIDNLLPTEPIDEAWTQEMLWLREHLTITRRAGTLRHDSTTCSKSCTSSFCTGSWTGRRTMALMPVPNTQNKVRAISSWKRPSTGTRWNRPGSGPNR